MTQTKDVFTFAATGTALSTRVAENGEVTMFIIAVPNFTNNVTTVITVKDVDGDTLWTSDALAKNGTYKREDLNIPLDYKYTITATISGVAGGSGGAVTIKGYVRTRDRR